MQISQFLFFVSWTVLAQCQAPPLQKFTESIYLIEEELSTYSFSCLNWPTGQLVALSADRKSLLFYDIERQQLRMTKHLPMPGQLIQSSKDGSLHVVTHNSYVTLAQAGNSELKVYPTSTTRASSVVIMEGLVCITPGMGRSATFLCLNIRNESNKWRKCDGYKYGLRGFADTAKGWVYTLCPGSDMNKFKPTSDQDCLESVQSHSNHLHSQVSDNDYGDHQIWFSYDGSRMFLNTGRALAASDDPDKDMKTIGYFNASNSLYYYNYISERSFPPYDIAGIRTDVGNTIYYYNGGSLMPVPDSGKPLPIPPQATSVHAEEVHICDITFVNVTYIVAKYGFPDGSIKTGVITWSGNRQ